MRKYAMISLLLLLMVVSLFATPRAYYRKVVAADPTVDILTLVTSNQTSYTAPNYLVTAFILGRFNEILSTDNGTPTTSIRLSQTGNGTTIPYYATVYLQLGSFPTQWMAGDTLRITVTKTDLLPNQTITWDQIIPIGTAAIQILNPAQEIPPEVITIPVELSSFTAVAISQGSVNLQWTTETETGIAGFYVYRSNDLNLNNAIVVNPNIIPGTNTTTSQTYTFTDQGVEHGTIYYYWLAVNYLDGTIDFHGPVIVSIPGINVELSSFSAVATVQGSVSLQWTTESETNFMGFNLFRSNENNLVFAIRINTSTINGTNTSQTCNYSYMDTSANPNSTFYYWLEMVMLDGTSVFSNCVAVTTITLPTELSSFTAVTTPQGFVNLQWTTESETNNLGFNVLRSIDNNPANAILVNMSMIPGTNTSQQQTYHFTDNDVTSPNTYYYWLENVDFSGSSCLHGPVIVHLDNDLPVELSSFTAMTTAQGYVNLQWTTESETNNLGFNVLRSTDDNPANATQVNMSMIQGTNTSQQQTYNFVDNSVNSFTTYYYWLMLVDFSGTVLLSNSIMVTTTVSVDDQIQLPENTTLLKSAYPNPFHENTTTNIGIQVKKGETASVTIYNILGQKVRTFSNETGSHLIVWNGKDENGSAVGSGIYFYRLVSPTVQTTKKMVVIK